MFYVMLNIKCYYYCVEILTDPVLSIFQSFGLLDKKSFKIPGIKDFSWSPTDNVLAYWVPENKDVPARVTLLEIPK
jgi:translation initiation factor 3 subunit B